MPCIYLITDQSFNGGGGGGQRCVTTTERSGNTVITRTVCSWEARLDRLDELRTHSHIWTHSLSHWVYLTGAGESRLWVSTASPRLACPCLLTPHLSLTTTCLVHSFIDSGAHSLIHSVISPIHLNSNDCVAILLTASDSDVSGCLCISFSLYLLIPTNSILYMYTELLLR